MAPVYQAAERFIDVALKRSDSLFTPGRTIWSLEICKDLHRRFTERPDTSEDSFENKFRRQLEGAPAATIQLAGELLFVHFLAAKQIGYEAKRSLIQRVLSWAPQPVTFPDQLVPALKDGVAKTGMAFNTYRPSMLWFLLDFVIHWKQAPEGNRALMLSDPWLFKSFVLSIPAKAAQTQQHALLHLVHPESFEPITSQEHKRKIASAFSNLSTAALEDVDQQLQEIRARLADKHGHQFMFYEPLVKQQWENKDDGDDGETIASTRESGPSYEISNRPTSCRYWVEKRIVKTESEGGTGEHGLGKALWSPQRAKNGNDIYWGMREIAPGDVVLHFIDNDRVAGVSRAASAPDSSFVGLPNTQWAGRPAIRVQLRDYVPLDPPILREEFLGDPALKPQLEAIVARNKNLFFTRYLDLNQGAYLTEAPLELVRLLDELYRRETDRGLPHVDLTSLPAGNTSGKPKDKSHPSMDWLVEETLWPQERLEEVIDAIRSRSPQVVLAGPPGTSKTWVAQRLAQYLTKGRNEACRLVQFHPSYSYEEFIEGLRPVVKDGGVSFDRVDGTVLRMARELPKGEDLGVLIIDEMNRANLPRVFGELMYAFEYRDTALDLQYSQRFALPKNLVFIGTMNTADRSIRSIDLALRRRFDVFECPPDVAILERYYETRENHVPDLLGGFEKLNAELEQKLDRHHTIGHTFFMNNPMTPDRLNKIWRHKIGPLVEEYFFDQPDTARAFHPGAFWTGP